MSKAVWKFPLEVSNTPQSFDIPTGGQIVHVAHYEGQPTMWVEVDPDRIKERRTFSVRGTGHRYGAATRHVGTAIDPELPLVWHIIESGEGT